MSEPPDFPPLLTDGESDESDDEDLPEIPHDPMWLHEILEPKLADEEAISNNTQLFHPAYEVKWDMFRSVSFFCDYIDF